MGSPGVSDSVKNGSSTNPFLELVGSEGVRIMGFKPINNKTGT